MLRKPLGSFLRGAFYAEHSNRGNAVTERIQGEYHGHQCSVFNRQVCADTDTEYFDQPVRPARKYGVECVAILRRHLRHLRQQIQRIGRLGARFRRLVRFADFRGLHLPHLREINRSFLRHFRKQNQRGEKQCAGRFRFEQFLFERKSIVFDDREPNSKGADPKLVLRCRFWDARIGAGCEPCGLPFPRTGGGVGRCRSQFPKPHSLPTLRTVFFATVFFATVFFATVFFRRRPVVVQRIPAPSGRGPGRFRTSSVKFSRPVRRPGTRCNASPTGGTGT